MQVRSLIGATALASLLLSPVSASAALGRDKDVPLLVGSPIGDVRSPYEPALKCLATVLTPEQKKTSFTVGSFPDQTGKTNYVSDSGTGMFSTQGAATMLYTSLGTIGVQVVNQSPELRQMAEYNLAKLTGNAPPEGLRVGMLLPDVVIMGAITSFDINVSSGGGGVRVLGIGGSRHKNRILVGMDGQLVEMPGGKGQAYRQVATTRIAKQIVGFQNEAGATGFFGAGLGTLFEIDLGSRKNEAIQYIERVMLDRVAFDLVASYFKVTACDEHRAYGDKLATPPEPPVSAPVSGAETGKK